MTTNGVQRMSISRVALMEWRMLAVFVAGLALALTTQTDSSAHAQDMGASGKDARVANTIGAWKKRENAIHNVKATLVVDTVLKPESLPTVAHARRLGSIQQPQKPLAAQHQHTQVFHVLLDFDNERYRVDRTGGMYNISRDSVQQEELITTFVGGRGKTYWHRPGTPGKPQSGMIDGKDAFSKQLSLGSTAALLFYVRPFGALPGLCAELLRPGDLRIVSTGPSGILEFAIEGEPDGRVWVDPKLDYALVRTASTTQQTTIEYGVDRVYGHVPKKATIASLGPRGGIGEAMAIRFKELQINVPLSDSMFEFEFPEGTHVDVIATVPRPPLVAKARGELVPQQRIEAGTRSRRTWIWRSIVATNVVILIVLAGFVLRRRLQRA